MSRGTTAAKWFGFEAWWQWSLGLSSTIILLVSCFELIASGLEFEFEFFVTRLIPLIFTLIFLLFAVFGLFLFPKFLRFAKAADEIFMAFGYPAPQKVGINKISNAYRKAHKLSWTGDNKADLWY
jgi:hypothetical protein